MSDSAARARCRYGIADLRRQAANHADTLFNLASLRKVSSDAAGGGRPETAELSLDDPVARYVPSCSKAVNISRVTLGQLATHTSGLLLRRTHPLAGRGYSCRSSSARS